ncbi:hypothetical protein [Erwinia sorbitola]|uniref:SMODS-associating 2TM beta-strand rich effector domain-containing protein n=1 Tax=Erwinia sorbitola TaxID=2681984 RepID=A0ABW9R700_9GAMM|nr:hypothetical protein [Erwinia sorbitola]MTD25837.1 hypothetical protein [Erwinia sorbitola]
MNDIVTGAISGVVTAGFLYLLKVLFTKHFIPLFQSYVYKGTDLTGKWTSSHIEDDAIDSTKKIKVDLTLNLTQKAHSVKGFLDVVIDRESGKENLNYLVKGEYSDGYMQLICSAKTPGFTSHSTILVKVIASGSMLGGIMTFRNSMTDTISYVDMNLTIRHG